jgi:HAD superfamily hydrolase (TIGR01509 family)
VIEAVIFDFDGVLIDSELLWTKADRRMLASHHISYSGGDRHLFTGRSQADAAEIFIKKFGMRLPRVMVIEQRLASLEEVYSEIEPQLMPGAEQLIKAIHQEGIKLAIASGTPKRIIEAIIKRRNLADFFGAVVSSDEVKRGKPSPDVYLYAASKINAIPEKCVVFEDAQSGALAAKSAGMFCIAVPNEHTKAQDFSMADLIISRLDETTLETIKNLD